MPLRLDIKRRLSQRSDRVKTVEIHPTEPWCLCAMYSGHCFLWNHANQQLVKSFEVSVDQPVRSAKFVPRKQWIVAGSDDMQIRVYNYNTLEKVKVFEAHSDYIRCIAVHPTLPQILSSSDDMTIKLWDWEKGWANTMVFEGHSHYVMMVTFNPKDANTFASASLDRSIKVWSLSTSQAHFTLEGHEKGVNCVDYFAGGDRPYLVSGADDSTVKVWDYQTKQCVQTLEGHTHNVAAVCCHPELPIILSGSEDGTVRVWHAHTYRQEYNFNYAYERCWSISALKGSNVIALGYDEGTIAIQLGNEEPIASMDAGGKVVLARHNEVSQVDIKKVEGADSIADGERLPLAAKELDVCEIYPQRLEHNSNGRFAVVTGDGEYIIYTALAWRKKSFGNALDFVWSVDSSEYAVREAPLTIKLFKNFKETRVFRPPFQADAIYGGVLLGVRSGEVTFFFDWAECRLIRRIDVTPVDIKWNDSGELVCISCEDSFFLLRYQRDLVTAAFDAGDGGGEEGIDGAFSLEHEIDEQISTCVWVGDCLVYTTKSGRLNYCIGGEVVTLHHLDKPLYIVGYIPKENRIYLLDREYGVITYKLLVSVLEYQTAVVRRDFDAAASILSSIPREEHDRIAHFLEAQGFKEEALSVAPDPEHQFELAVQLGKLQMACEIARRQPTEARWKQLGDLALVSGDLALAEECLVLAADLPGLLLLYSSSGNADGIEKLAQLAQKKGKLNISFICSFMRGKVDECLELLLSAGREPEAAFFARTYAPSQISRIVGTWREKLAVINQKAADSIADPASYPNLFVGLEHALKAEEWLSNHGLHEAPAAEYPEHALDTESDLIEHMKLLEAQQPEAPAEEEMVEEAAEAVGEVLAVEAAIEPEEAEAAVDPEEADPEEAPELEAEPEVEAAPDSEVSELAAELEGAELADAGDAESELQAELEAELDAELEGDVE